MAGASRHQHFGSGQPVSHKQLSSHIIGEAFRQDIFRPLQPFLSGQKRRTRQRVDNRQQDVYEVLELRG